VTDRGRRRWIGPAIVAAIVVVAVFALQPRGATTPDGAGDLARRQRRRERRRWRPGRDIRP
jgi:hypothetical protein